MSTNNKNFKVKKGLVTGSDVNTSGVVFSDYTKGFVLTSPSGYKYRLGVEVDGSLSTDPMFFSVEYLVVAGGGGSTGNKSGGGGGGGLLTGFLIPPEGIPQSLIVGAGGSVVSFVASNGSNSVLSLETAIGGGFGSGGAGASGGSGGASAGAGTSGQGNSGGLNIFVPQQSNVGGGGGGAGGAGKNSGSGSWGDTPTNQGQSHSGGKGGLGLDISITGLLVGYAGGGGGACGYCNIATAESGLATHGGGRGSSVGSAGTVNTGGGGGGGSYNATGGAGGSGIVILKYPDTVTATFSAGVTQSTSVIGEYKISEITATSTTSETVTFV